ncbi:hypothetical protein V0U79_09210 [Hyphobacterium sp. HN65]|uniref:Prolipoprotein diacylglyceryl transferase n=1 Tax=Hyphobacterium lacteum TaxID=3116575 RepID=A0ABU7LT80_9PROT|nr:hypothetical protein [Hyphobacterium sp. HN65]MEE2526544.1 hypothetical protein [Hyphobacterium sp. HN65]
MTDTALHIGPLVSFLAAALIAGLALFGMFWRQSHGLRQPLSALPFLGLGAAIGAGALLSIYHNQNGEVLGWLFASETVDFGVSEYGIVLALAGITGLSVVLAWRSTGLARPVYALIALACFFIAGEELSWGQWIFHWSTPDSLAEVNLQNETNLHNLVDPRLYDVVYAVIGWATLLTALFAAGLINRSARTGDFIVFYLLRSAASWLRTGRFALLLTLSAAVLLQHELFEEYAEFVFGSAAFLFFLHLYRTVPMPSRGRLAHA